MACAAVLCFLCCLITPSVGSPLHPDKYERAFAKYVKEYNRSYATSLEKLARFDIFRTRLQHIDEVNLEDVGFHLAPNKLTDRFPEEQRQDRRDRFFVQGPGASRAESFSRALRGAHLTPAPAVAVEAGQRVQLSSIALDDGPLETDARTTAFQKELADVKAKDAALAAGNGQRSKVASVLHDARGVAQEHGADRAKTMLRALSGADAFYIGLTAR